jgi:hypothetical protein
LHTGLISCSTGTSIRARGPDCPALGSQRGSSYHELRTLLPPNKSYQVRLASVEPRTSRRHVRHNFITSEGEIPVQCLTTEPRPAPGVLRELGNLQTTELGSVKPLESGLWTQILTTVLPPAYRRPHMSEFSIERREVLSIHDPTIHIRRHCCFARWRGSSSSSRPFNGTCKYLLES